MVYWYDSWFIHILISYFEYSIHSQVLFEHREWTVRLEGGGATIWWSQCRECTCHTAGNPGQPVIRCDYMSSSMYLIYFTGPALSISHWSISACHRVAKSALERKPTRSYQPTGEPLCVIVLKQLSIAIYCVCACMNTCMCTCVHMCVCVRVRVHVYILILILLLFCSGFQLHYCSRVSCQIRQDVDYSGDGWCWANPVPIAEKGSH